MFYVLGDAFGNPNGELRTHNFEFRISNAHGLRDPPFNHPRRRAGVD